MPPVRLTLLRLLDDSLASRINFLGVRAMMEQAGLPWRECRYAQLKKIDWLPSDVLVVPDCEQMSAREWRAVRQFGRLVPAVYVGIPRADLLEEVSEWFGLRDVSLDRSGVLRLLGPLNADPTSKNQSAHSGASDQTTSGRFNNVPHLVGEPAEGLVTRDLCLGDGTPLSPALVLKPPDDAPGRCLFTFPFGILFARRTSHHIDLRTDAETLGWPVDLTIDSLRADFTGVLRLVQPTRPIIRRWFWPADDDDEVPAGAFTLTHDLCGFDPRGLEFIEAVCKVHRIVTTFFDYPPFHLKRGDAKGHVIALHVSGGATEREIRDGLARLARRHGRKIRGWRRHGRTEPDHYPRIWRNLERAGIEWTNTFPAQSHPHRSLCSPVGTSNRLPFRRIDLDSGKQLRQLELPVFDTDDADHLTNIKYGMRLSRQRFEEVASERLRASAALGLAAGYLLHGWTAGVEDGVGRGYGAQDCRDMVTFAVGLARRLNMSVMDCETMYDWWCARERAETVVGEDGARLTAPDAGFRVAWQVRGVKTPEVIAKTRRPGRVVANDRGVFVVLEPGDSCTLLF
ncbi:MAG: hypothetical protein ACE5O2_12680 [Armatimonadota bacterium]